MRWTELIRTLWESRWVLAGREKLIRIDPGCSSIVFDADGEVVQIIITPGSRSADQALHIAKQLGFEPRWIH